MNYKFVIISILALIISACAEKAEIKDNVTAFRFRADFNSEIDEDEGWASQENQATEIQVDTPFRLRFEVEAMGLKRRQYSLQYKKNDNPWEYAEAHHFPYPSAKSPVLSIIDCEAYFYGEEADDLLKSSNLKNDHGAGVCLSPTSPGWIPSTSDGASAEFEWSLVVRNWADGAKRLINGDKFSLRMVNKNGNPLDGLTAEFTVKVPDYHIGGTFVETPTRIGPYENSNGDLYFIMEPTETGNVFMMIKSTDAGKTWFEVDATNRPKANDLEGVGSVISDDGIIHIVHETSDFVYYHSFSISGESADSWITTDEIIAEIEKPDVQTADIAIRQNGDLIVAFAEANTLKYSIKSNGEWSKAKSLDEQNTVGMTNPNLLTLPDGTMEIAYKSYDGIAWNKQLTNDNKLSSTTQFADELGTEEHESMAILPLIHIEDKNITIVAYRKSSGYLFAKYKSSGGNWSRPISISDHSIVTNAVDSDQAGADIVEFGGKIYATYIGEETKEIYLSILEDFQSRAKITKLISKIDGSWIRGNILLNQNDSPIYGYIYDAGSLGGSGFNRFGKHLLEK